jgi:GTPase SAR1 family protein
MIIVITGHKLSGKTSYINIFINDNTIIRYYSHNITIYYNLDIIGYLNNIIIEIDEDFFTNECIQCNNVNTLIKDCNYIMIFQDIRKRLDKNDLLNLYNILKTKNPYINISIVGNKTDLVDINTYNYNINILKTIECNYYFISVLNNVNILAPLN